MEKMVKSSNSMMMITSIINRDTTQQIKTKLIPLKHKPNPILPQVHKVIMLKGVKETKSLIPLEDMVKDKDKVKDMDLDPDKVKDMDKDKVKLELTIKLPLLQPIMDKVDHLDMVKEEDLDMVREEPQVI